MSSSEVWFATFDIKSKKVKKFFDYLKDNQIEYDLRYRLGRDVGLIIWREPYFERNTVGFWHDIKQFCTKICASEYEETGEHVCFEVKKC